MMTSDHHNLVDGSHGQVKRPGKSPKTSASRYQHSDPSYVARFDISTVQFPRGREGRERYKGILDLDCTISSASSLLSAPKRTVFPERRGQPSVSDGVCLWVDGVNPGIRLCIVHPDKQRGWLGGLVRYLRYGLV